MYAGDDHFDALFLVDFQGALHIWVDMNMNKTLKKRIQRFVHKHEKPQLHQIWLTMGPGPFVWWTYGTASPSLGLVSGDLALLQEKLQKSFNLSLSGVIDIRTFSQREEVAPYRCNMQSTWHKLLYKRNINLWCLSWSADLLPCHSCLSFIIFDFDKHYFIEAVFITVPKKISFSTCIRPLLRPTWKFFAWPGLLIGHRDPAWIRRQW